MMAVRAVVPSMSIATTIIAVIQTLAANTIWPRAVSLTMGGCGSVTGGWGHEGFVVLLVWHGYSTYPCSR